MKRLLALIFILALTGNAHAGLKAVSNTPNVSNATGTLPAANGTMGIINVMEYGAKGDGTTDDTTAIQNALNATMIANGRQLFFPSGNYKITSSLVIGNTLATGWKIEGDSRGGTHIIQATNNTPIFHFIHDLTHSWEIEDIYFDWSTPQSSSNTLAIAIYFDAGASTNIFNFQIHRCTFNDGFRAIASSGLNQESVWGAHIYDNVFGGQMTGAAVYLSPSPAIGQPNISIEDSYIDAASATEPSIYITTGDVVVLKNIEFNDGSVATNSTGTLVYIASTNTVQLIGVKAEVYHFGSSNSQLFNFPQSDVLLENVEVITFDGTGNPILFSGNSGARLAIHGMNIYSAMTGGNAVAYSAPELVSAENINLTGSHITNNPRSQLGNVAMPRITADNLSMDYSLTNGDSDLTMAAGTTAARVVIYNTTLTANRTVTLPNSGINDGNEFTILRTAGGAFSLQVSDPVSAVNFTFPANTTGWVKYRALGTGSYAIVGSGFNVTQPGIVTGGTKFTTTGCSVSATSGGATAGTYTSGTTGTCTVVVTMNGATGLTAPNGWACYASDRTTAADTQVNTTSTTTTATISGTTVSGDVVSFGCAGY